MRNIWRLGKVRDTIFSQMSLLKCYWILQNVRVIASRFWVIKGNPTESREGEGVKLPPTQIKILENIRNISKWGGDSLVSSPGPPNKIIKTRYQNFLLLRTLAWFLYSPPDIFSRIFLVTKSSIQLVLAFIKLKYFHIFIASMLFLKL